GQHGGERALDEREHGNEVAALRARDGEVVEVEHGEGDAPGEQELGGIGARCGGAHVQVHALRLVVAAAHRRVDTGVDAVGGEVQQNGGVLVGAVGAAGAPAAADGRAGPAGDQRGD